jgi:type IX secretion system PorP/SprF family membrane protein
MNNIFKCRVALVIGVLFFTITAKAQYQLNNRMVQQNKFGINPAYAGEYGKTRIALIGSYTPTKLENANNYLWQQATLETPLKDNLSTGTTFSNISQGNFSQMQIKQAFAYKVKFSEKQNLSVGFSFGLNRESLNYKNGFNPNEYVDLSDPYLNKDNYAENNLGLEIGAVYRYDNFQISLSMPAVVQQNGNYRGVTAYTAYKIVLNEEWDVSPSVLMLQTEKEQYEFTSTVGANYLDKFWLQVGYTDVSQFVMGAGFKVKGLGLFYNVSVPFDSKYGGMVGSTNQFGMFFNL